jgi:hypothetical protein
MDSSLSWNDVEELSRYKIAQLNRSLSSLVSIRILVIVHRDNASTHVILRERRAANQSQGDRRISGSSRPEKSCLT